MNSDYKKRKTYIQKRPCRQQYLHVYCKLNNQERRNTDDGAGCAKSVRDMFEGIDGQFGGEIDHYSVFGIKFVEWRNMQWIGAFQTKIDWRKDSPLDVVQHSIGSLNNIATARTHWTFHLPCPAVNHGGNL